jgi:hypothetical protein
VGVDGGREGRLVVGQEVEVGRQVALEGLQEPVVQLLFGGGTEAQGL